MLFPFGLTDERIPLHCLRTRIEPIRNILRYYASKSIKKKLVSQQNACPNQTFIFENKKHLVFQNLCTFLRYKKSASNRKITFDIAKFFNRLHNVRIGFFGCVLLQLFIPG